MNADDLNELYKLVRGSKAAMIVLDARAHFVDGELPEAHSKLIEARTNFIERRSRLLKNDVAAQVDQKAKDSVQQIRRLERKREKVLKVVERFDELSVQLARVAIRAAAEEQSEHSEQAASDSSVRSGASLTPATPDDVSVGFVRDFKVAKRDEHFSLISRSFGFCEIVSEEQIVGNAVYYIRTDNRTLLVRTPRRVEHGKRIPLTRMTDGRTITPLTLKAFMSLGRQRQMVLLTMLGDQNGSEAKPVNRQDEDSDSRAPGIVDQQVLDMGAFSQLLSAAQRSGLADGADQIAYVRDREFRMGKFDQAFQAINGIYTRFSSNAARRTQQIIREDSDISAGRIEMSPRDVRAKKIRDQMQTQEVDRAKRRFQIVLKGLRILMNR